MPTYDNLGRTASRVSFFLVNSADAFYREEGFSYNTYYDAEYGLVCQSAQVSEYTSGIAVSGTATQDVTTYGFTYDENGNITEICDSEGPSRGSITTTTSGSLSGKTTAHSEKLTSGHMITPETSKKTYAFTTGTLGSVQGTQSYTYDAWGNCTELGIVLYSST